MVQKHLKKKEHELEDAIGEGKLASGFKNHTLKSQPGKVVNVQITQKSATCIPGELSLGLDFISNEWLQESILDVLLKRKLECGRGISAYS